MARLRATLVSRFAGVRIWVGVAFCVAYVLADTVRLFPHARYGVQPWNLHPAFALALIALGGNAYLPFLIAAIVASWWFGATSFGIEVLPAALCMAAVYWGGGLALHRWAAWGGTQVRPRDVHVLLLVCICCAILGGLVDALRQIAMTDLNFSAMPILALRTCVANLLGMVVLMPAILLWGAGAGRPASHASLWRAARNGAIFAVAMGALLILVFGLKPLDEFRMSYLLFLPMTAFAMRYGVFGAANAIPVAQLGLLAALTMVGSRTSTAFEFQLLILTMAISALYLGALTDERARSTARIAEHERTLRERGQALAEAQRIASTAELAAALAHDLSQPLSAIGTYARASQVLAERGPDEQRELLETLGQISLESARAGQYLRRMREFFRTGTMHADSVDVAGLFDNTFAHLRDRLLREDIHWRVSVEPGLPPVCADAVQTGAILGNLVANACDALGGKTGWREIHLKAARASGASGPAVRVVVEDSGPGVPQEVRARLFAPLATSKPGGMGLGLALSRSIAERQGGRLWFDAESARTTFCLDLPLQGSAG